MLLQFTVENFRSIREPVTLSMLAAEHVDHPEGSVYEVEGIGKVLKVAAIYGANASGKSNLVDAWGVLCDLAADGLPTSGRPAVEPFALDPSCRTKPTRFEVHARLGEGTFAYALAIGADGVVQESLHVGGGEALDPFFERARGTGPRPTVQFAADLAKEFGEERAAFYQHVAEGCRHNQPLLAELRSRNAHELDGLYDYFDNAFLGPDADPGHRMANVPLEAVAAFAAADLDERAFLERALKDADPNLKGLRFVFPGNPEFAARLNRGETLESTTEARDLLDRGDLGIRFDVTGGTLSFDQLSAGTKRMAGLAWVLEVATTNPVVLAIDELDRSFHTALTRAIVRNAFTWCQGGSQLLFTTHDTNLLDANLLGHDGIWFMEKDPDGASHLWSLAEFDPDQLAAMEGQLEDGYLEGRFGAIPFVGRAPFRKPA